MTDIRQTLQYANYLKLLGWEIIKIKQGQIFIKKFSLIGSIIKVQRITPPIPFEEIEKIAKEYRAFQILIDQELPQKSLAPSKPQAKSRGEVGPPPTPPPNFKINKASYFPSKTIWIDLERSEKEIFSSFSEAKRRAVRRAEKNGVTIKEVTSPKEFLWLKKYSLWEKMILPIATGQEVNTLYKSFFPKNANILIAFYQEKPIAGIFLLHTGEVSYYWLAAATNNGKKLFAPTLLTWEAFKLAKKIGCQIFDFEGVYDERYPIKSWLGFTKFKEGFGGKEIYHPPSLIKMKLPFKFI
jgi:hypothetical protein